MPVSACGVTIRDAVEADASAVAQLLTELGYPSEDVFARQQIRHLAGRPDDRVLVAVVDGEVHGFVALHMSVLFAESAPVGRITAFCVRASSRSRGIGIRVLEYVERMARLAGCGRMEVTSNASRAKAHVFYQRHGYAEYTKFFRKSLSAGALSAGAVVGALAERP